MNRREFITIATARMAQIDNPGRMIVRIYERQENHNA